jgi:hypothetical protein
MENINFVISAQEIDPKIISEGEHFNRQRQGTAITFGGILFAALREAPRADLYEPLSGIRAFLVFWDTAGPGTAKLRIKGIVEQQYLPDRTTPDPEPDNTLEDSRLIALLTNPNLDSSLYIPCIISSDQPPRWVNNTPNMYFKLSFLDSESYEYLSQSNHFYFKGEEGNGRVPNYYRANIQNTANPFIDDGNLVTQRGIKFTNANGTFIHGIPIISEFTNTPYNSPLTFSTLMARPDPEPIIVDNNHPGALAYKIMPSCPPYWKPGSQIVDSLPFLGENASKAEKKALEESLKKKMPCLPVLTSIAIVIIIIIVLYAFYTK